jgi:hypothetical protein
MVRDLLTRRSEFRPQRREIRNLAGCGTTYQPQAIKIIQTQQPRQLARDMMRFRTKLEMQQTD